MNAQDASGPPRLPDPPFVPTPFEVHTEKADPRMRPEQVSNPGHLGPGWRTVERAGAQEGRRGLTAVATPL